MPLVEGLGDEVTVILGLLTIIIVLLIAWFSTHTRDIPFFSVVVVELSQRVSRNQRSSTPAAGQSASTNEENVETSTADGAERDDPSTAQADSPSVENAEATEISQEQHCASETAKASSENADSCTGVESKTKDTAECVKSGKVGLTAGSSHGSEQDSIQVDEATVSSTSNETSTDSQTISHTEPITETEQSQSALPSSPTPVESGVRHRNVPSNDSALPSVSPQMSSDFLDASSGSHLGQIRIRLKYLNDTQRLVYSSPTDTIGQFRREHFSTELEANKLVRLIFNGRDMRNDGNTLQGYNITDNSVIHCLVTQNMQSAPPLHVDAGDADVQLGAFMMPLFAFVLAAIWYLRITQRQYFNAVSTLSLAGITFLFLLGCASVWRGADRANNGHQHVE